MWAIVLFVALLIGLLLYTAKAAIVIWIISSIGTLMLGLLCAVLLPILIPAFATLMLPATTQPIAYAILTILGLIIGVILGYTQEQLPTK